MSTGNLTDDFKIIMWFLRPHWIKVFLIFLFLFIYSILETVSIGAFYPLINNIVSADGHSVKVGGKILELLNFIVRQLPIAEDIIAASVFLLILVVGSALFGFFAESFTTWYRYKFYSEFLNRVYHRFLSNQYRFFLEKKQGDLLYIGINASQSVGEMLLYFPKVGVEFFRLIAISIFLLTISLKVTLAVFCVMVFYGIIIHFLSNRIVYPIALNLQNTLSELTSIFSESIAGIKQIKIFENLKFWHSRFTEQSHRARILSTKNVIYADIPRRLIMIVGVSSVVVSIIYVKTFFAGQFIVILPIIAVYVLAVQRLMPSICSIGHHWMGLKGLSPRLQATYNTLINREYLIEDGKRDFEGLTNNIKLENLSFAYPAKNNVLKEITMNIPKGKTIAIVGESGSGKSTLVDILIRLYEPTAGRILVDNIDYRKFARSSWLSRVGMVTQDTFIFHASVRDNIKMGKPDATDREVIEAAKTAHAHQFIMELPGRYDTVLGDRGIKLSGGQRQRIAIARAIIRNPDILILDEATSSLDNISEKIVQEALQGAKQNKTTIIIAHRLSTVEYADRIAVMHLGNIVEEGTHEDLLRRQGYYYDLYQRQKNILVNSHNL